MTDYPKDTYVVSTSIALLTLHCPSGVTLAAVLQITHTLLLCFCRLKYFTMGVQRVSHCIKFHFHTLRSRKTINFIFHRGPAAPFKRQPSSENLNDVNHRICNVNVQIIFNKAFTISQKVKSNKEILGINI